MVEEELRKPHHVASEPEEHGQDGGGEKPPFLLPLVEEQAQQEKEHRYRPHVHRAGSERLGAPVERKMLCHLVCIALSRLAEKLDHFRLPGIHRSGGRAPVEIRYHEVGQFLPAVRPGCGIVQLEAVGVDGLPFGMRKLGTSPHRVGRIFIQRGKGDRIGAYSEKADDQKEAGSGEEAAGLVPRFLAGHEGQEKPDHIDRYHQGEIIGDLLMVGLDLETQGQAEEHCPQKGLGKPFTPCRRGFAVQVLDCRLISEYERSQDPGKEGKGLHLRVVPHLDDLEVVGTERNRNRTDYRHKDVDSEGKHQEEGPY